MAEQELPRFVDQKVMDSVTEWLKNQPEGTTFRSIGWDSAKAPGVESPIDKQRHRRLFKVRNLKTGEELRVGINQARVLPGLNGRFLIIPTAKSEDAKKVQEFDKENPIGEKAKAALVVTKAKEAAEVKAKADKEAEAKAKEVAKTT